MKIDFTLTSPPIKVPREMDLSLHSKSLSSGVSSSMDGSITPQSWPSNALGGDEQSESQSACTRSCTARKPPSRIHSSPIPIPCHNTAKNEEDREAEERLTDMYNRATWDMYNRYAAN